MIKMAQLEDIRKMYFMEDLSIREISRRTDIHRLKDYLYAATCHEMASIRKTYNYDARRYNYYKFITDERWNMDNVIKTLLFFTFTGRINPGKILTTVNSMPSINIMRNWLARRLTTINVGHLFMQIRSYLQEANLYEGRYT